MARLFRLLLKSQVCVNSMLLLSLVVVNASTLYRAFGAAHTTELNDSLKYDVFSARNDATNSVNQYKRACYLDSTGGIDADLIDPFLCTHLLLFYSNVDDAGKPIVTEIDLQKLSKAIRLKQMNPSLLLSLTIGGTNENFARASSSREYRIAFADELKSLITLHGLDGIDLDWEFPGYFNDYTERHNFTLLLEVIRDMLKSFEEYKYLSTAVGAPKIIVDSCYEVEAIAKLVDFVSIMCYDFYLFSAVTPTTGHNAPLFHSQEDVGYFTELNTNFSVHYWIEKGMSRDKILVGLPTYGRGYVLRSENMHGLYAPVVKPLGDGYVGLADVCAALSEGGVEVWDPYALVSYAYKDKLWYSYANVRSIEAKVVFSRTLGVAGVMTFDLNRDDPYNICKLGSFPLHHLIREILV